MIKLPGLLILIFIIASAAGQQAPDYSILPDTVDINEHEQLIELISVLAIEERYPEAKQVLDLASEEINKQDDLHNWCRLQYYLADYYFYNESYKKASDCFEQIIPLFRELNDTLLLISSMNGMGLIAEYRQNNQDALKYYLDILELIDQIKNKAEDIKYEEMAVMVNIANLYNGSQNYEELLEFAPKVIKMALEINDSLALGAMYNAMGIACKALGRYQDAIEHYRKTASIYLESNDPLRYYIVLNNTGALYNDLEMPDSALFYYKRSLSGFQDYNFSNGLTKTKLGLARIYLQLDQADSARQLYRQVVDSAEVYHLYDTELDALFDWSELEFEQKNFEKAYHLLLKYNFLADSVFTLEKEQKYAELLTQYESTLQENEINQLKTEKLAQEFALDKNLLRIKIAIAFIALLLFTLYITLRFNHQRRKANEQLRIKNQQIERQNQHLTNMNKRIANINKELEKSKASLLASNSAKSRFFSILAHDLRNPLHNVRGMSSLLSGRYDDLSPEERRHFASDIHQSCEKVNRLLENLLDWSRTQTGSIEFNPEQLNLYHVASDALAVLQNSASNKAISIENLIDQNIFFTADKAMLETLFRNLINNGIKFTPSQGSIKLEAKAGEDSIRVSIADNGVGIHEEHLKRIFDIDANFKTPGTHNESGSGLGLVICKELIAYHKGRIWAKSQPGKGSVFYFELPLESIKHRKS